MTKQVALVEFNSRFSAILHYDDGSVAKVPEYVPDMKDKVQELLKEGIKVEATSRPSKSLLEEMLGTIPDEEEEPGPIMRFRVKMKGGMSKPFVDAASAEGHWKRYCRNVPLEIVETPAEVQA